MIVPNTNILTCQLVLQPLATRQHDPFAAGPWQRHVDRSLSEEPRENCHKTCSTDQAARCRQPRPPGWAQEVTQSGHTARCVAGGEEGVAHGGEAEQHCKRTSHRPTKLERRGVRIVAGATLWCGPAARAGGGRGRGREARRSAGRHCSAKKKGVCVCGQSRQTEQAQVWGQGEWGCDGTTAAHGRWPN